MAGPCLTSGFLQGVRGSPVLDQSYLYYYESLEAELFFQSPIMLSISPLSASDQVLLGDISATCIDACDLGFVGPVTLTWL